MKKAILQVELHCENCEKAVHNALADLGITNAVTSIENNQVEFEYDPTKISLKKIKEEIM
ncbi:MAG: cation transporter [Defluviitaleaceae bacterium]|nr:cation transporter [Defluviitaleaceae bacterium]